MPRRIDLTGRRFGELEVIRLSETVHRTGKRMWECKCHACGNTTHVFGYSLLHGNYTSCGCQQPIKRDRGLMRHIAADRVDGTRISALRQKPHKDNKSGHKGVRWDEKKQRWKAYIGFRGRNISLGSYLTKEEAIEARQKGEEKYHKPILEAGNHEE